MTILTILFLYLNVGIQCMSCKFPTLYNFLQTSYTLNNVDYAITTNNKRVL